jgi:regulator of protease activity HflC (stomatin/prohibitin superfamily)
LLKDITFSEELQNLFSSAATQKRIGESKVIAARAEVDAAKLMRQAADILASPAAMQIRQLDALQNMAKTSGSKVVFGESLRMLLSYPTSRISLTAGRRLSLKLQYR